MVGLCLIITVRGELRSVMVLPEITFNAGWSDLSKKIEVFVNKAEILQRETLNAGEITSNGEKEKGSYKESIEKGRWPPNELQSVPESSTNGDKGPLRRSLVGSFLDCDEIPSRNDVRKWAQNTWRGIHNIQVFDLKGFQFLFEFQSRRDAESVLAGRWRRCNQLLEMEWWSPMSGAIPSQKHFDWFWVRILGLLLHLWSDEVMKEMGDQCGGWIEMEEETQLKNHLRWAYIRVKRSS